MVFNAEEFLQGITREVIDGLFMHINTYKYNIGMKYIKITLKITIYSYELHQKGYA